MEGVGDPVATNETAESNSVVFVFASGRDPFEYFGLLKRVTRTDGRDARCLFLRDTLSAGYFRGVAGFGETIEQAAASMRAMASEMGAKNLRTFGVGLGGLAAMIYGVVSRAQRIVAVEPPAHLIRDELERYNDHRWTSQLDDFPDPKTARHFQIPELLRRTGYAGRPKVLLGTRRVNPHHDGVHLNVLHAQWLAWSPQIDVVPFRDSGPGLLQHLRERGDAEDVLAQHLYDPESPPPVSARSRRDLPLARKTIFHCPIALSSEPNGVELVPSHPYATAARPTNYTGRPLNDGWRAWLAENILLDAPPEGLAGALEARGFARDETYLTISRLLQHPCFVGSKPLRRRLADADDVLTGLRDARRLRSDSGSIPRCHLLGRDAFLESFYSLNRPALITGYEDTWQDMLMSSSMRRLPDFIDPQVCGELAETELVAETVLPAVHEIENVLLVSRRGRFHARLAPSWDLPLVQNHRGLEAVLPNPQALSAIPERTQPEVHEADVEPGQFLFIPVGWSREVVAIDPTSLLMIKQFVFDNDFQAGCTLADKL